MPAAIALIGDLSPDVTAHRAIPRALALAGQAENQPVPWTWEPTASIQDPAGEPSRFTAFWVVPASPGASMAGALAAELPESIHPFSLGTLFQLERAAAQFSP
jgi:hypothetical protein